MAKRLDRIKALEEKKAKLLAEIAKEKAKHSKEERRRDTRRKVLVGAMVLAKVESGEYPEDKLKESLNVFLTKPADRALFDLDPKVD